MLTLRETSLRSGGGLDGFAWDRMTRAVVFDTFYTHPDRDFLVTPDNLLENGQISETRPMDAAFDCPLLPTPFLRNLFRLYATVANMTQMVQLGIPEDDLSKLRALELGHPHLLEMYYEPGSLAASSLKDIYAVMFKDVISPPARSPEATAII